MQNCRMAIMICLTYGNGKGWTTYLFILKLFLGEVMLELVEFVHFGCCLSQSKLDDFPQTSRGRLLPGR